MSPDEIERTMQFLLNQQAKFSADFERLSEKTERVTDALVGLTGIVGRLAESQQETDRQLRDTKARVDDLGDYIKSVESQLLDMFERHLREDHGRRPS